MGEHTFIKTMAGLVGALALTACGGDPADEYRQALPQASELTVDYPGSGQTSEGGVGTKASGLVGGPANLYTATYYESRKINAFGKGVVELIERITQQTPTEMDENHAVWGPMSAPDEPNEFRLTVVRDDQASPVRYGWRIEGKHKSGGEDDYITLGQGVFEPDGSGEHRGRGLFGVSFDNIHSLNPAEDGRGRIAYAFVVNDEGVQVRAAFDGPDADGQPDAAYAFGADVEGNRFVLFAVPDNLDLGPISTEQKEALLIRTRWNDAGGRADAVATKGDLGPNFVHVSQCWDDSLVSTYESLKLNGVMQQEDGDPTTCSLSDENVPNEDELPSGEELEDSMPN